MTKRHAILLALNVAYTNSLHATFGRAQAMSLCRKWVSSVIEPARHPSSAIVRARLALEHPSSFMIVAFDDENTSTTEGVATAYVCTPVGSDVHRIDAIMWADSCDLSASLDRVRGWHSRHWPNKCLAPGKLTTREVDAWRM